MARSPSRSIPALIIMSSVAVGLGLAVLVGWIAVVLRNQALTQQVSQNVVLLVAGTLSLTAIITVLVLFAVFLVREIREGRRQTTFIDSVTHELKSPLASLKLCLETIAREGVNLDQREQLRQMMLDDVERLALFIDDILVSSRVANRLFLEPSAYRLEEINVRALTMRCAQVIARRHKIGAQAIQCDVPEDLALTTDHVALETALKNLLDNAVKYSDPNPEVVVTAKVLDGKKLCIEVSDRGIGIPPAHLKRVFDRFYRVPREDVRSRRGTGLGLFVVSALIRSLGGRMEAESVGPGQGTKVRMLMPYEPAA